MAAIDIAGPSSASRKIRRLGIGVAVVVALYSAGWYYVASKFEAYLDNVINHGGPGSLNVQCDKLSTGGFPFLIGFSCGKTVVGSAGDGNVLTAGAFSAAARIYNPGTAVVELGGPANASLEDGSSISGKWQKLRASFRANLSGLSTLSTEGKSLTFELTSPQLIEALTFAASDGQLHLRNNDGNLDGALMARDFQLTDGSGVALLPTISTSAELTLIDKGKMLEGVPLGSKKLKGKLTSFKIEGPNGLFGEMSGPFKINEEGYLSGTFKTRLEKLDLWENTLRAIFPEAGDTISGVAIMLRGLAKGGDEVTVKLKVDDGNISLSFLPLGHIPPI
jgi:hypothetical protein